MTTDYKAAEQWLAVLKRYKGETIVAYLDIGIGAPVPYTAPMLQRRAEWYAKLGQPDPAYRLTPEEIRTWIYDRT